MFNHQNVELRFSSFHIKIANPFFVSIEEVR